MDTFCVNVFSSRSLFSDTPVITTRFSHLPPGWCLIKYVPYLPIEFISRSLTGSMSSATAVGRGRTNVLPHSPYSPDIAPLLGFYLFAINEESLQRCRFVSSDEGKSASQQALRENFSIILRSNYGLIAWGLIKANDRTEKDTFQEGSVTPD
ncbi:hypothetical protein TNCV_4111781 [Trichonephila clavipes]|nr:hypothetical protein TNCV_4111781 [Trichonephila clavipes]